MMKISDLGEFGLIERIRTSLSPRSSRTLLGIGDDAAALTLAPRSVLLATTDMLIEGIHFDRTYTDFASLGWKSAAVNLSDIAAMGGTPCFCLVALGLPSSVTARQVADFYKGFGACCRRHGAEIVGGDTCGSPKGIVVSVTALGETSRKGIVTRGGARPGDFVLVTGTLGDAAAGLEMLKTGIRDKGVRGKKAKSSCVERHLRPQPRVEWGKKLAAAGCVTAMIDVSDGLSSDLGHICDESGVGAVLFEQDIPISAAVRSMGLRRRAVEYALSGGEDYELLFTVPPRRMKKFESLRIKAAVIGTITEGRELSIIGADGGIHRLRRSGYDHFRRTGRNGS